MPTPMTSAPNRTSARPRPWALTVALCLFTGALAAHDVRPDFASEARAYLSAQAEASGFMGSVLVVEGGEVRLREGYGFADLEHQVANTPDTVFRIGSISKSFTGALIQQLSSEGAVDLAAPVSGILDGLPQKWAPITLRHLLGHRSGILDLEDMPGYRETMTQPTRPDQTMRRFFEVPLRFPAGAHFEYSSSGYVLLAAVAEVVTGRPYEELLRERVLDPMGLVDTGPERQETLVPHRARGYTWGATGLENAAYIHMSLPLGGGELLSTVDDMARWARGLERGELLTGEALEALLTPEPIVDADTRHEMGNVFGIDFAEGGYASGWAFGRQHGRPCRQHGGAINGFTGSLTRYPQDDVTVVVLSNVETYFTTLDIGVDLAAMLFGEPYTTPEPVPHIELPPGTLADYTGAYELRPGLDLTISAEGAQLLAQLGDGPIEPIVPRSETEFSYRTNRMTITFLPGDGGPAPALDLRVNPALEVRGRRTP